MHLAFVTTNSKTVRFGVMYLMSYVRSRTDWEVSLLEYKSDDQIEEVVRTLAPDIIGFSAMTGDYKQYTRINRTLKRSGIDFLSIWGGPHPTFSPEIVEDEGVDAVCIGEGEEALAELCSKWPLEQKDDYAIPNWIFQTPDGLIRNDLRPLMDLATLPAPDYTMFDLKGKKSVSATLSRGCFYRCTYCFNRNWKKMYASRGSPIRVYDVDRVIHTLKALKNQCPTVEYVVFHDSVFPSTHEDWVDKLLEQYGREIGVPFQVNLHPATVSAPLVRKLKKAGGLRVNFSIESGSERIRRDVLDRHTPDDMIVRAAQTIREAGLALSIQNMTCLPRETWKDARATFELNIKCKPDIAVISKFVPYPKTELAELAIREGYIKDEHFADKIPDNYHWVSLLEFPDERDKQKMEFLVNFFTLGTCFRFLKPLIYALINVKPRPAVVRAYAYMDTHTWLTVTRQNINQMRENIEHPVSSKLFLFFRLLVGIIFNRRNPKAYV
ncbi:B12-binding domain-containing radical SAM protein [Verrucomicrobiota bacterium]